MKINKSSAKINIVIFHVLSAQSMMCKTSHISLKLTHQNYLCHFETLASLPRLAPNISAFRPANYVFWRATFKRAFFRAGVHAAAHVLSFYPVHQFQDLNSIFPSVFMSFASLPMLFTASPAANA